MTRWCKRMRQVTVIFTVHLEQRRTENCTQKLWKQQWTPTGCSQWITRTSVCCCVRHHHKNTFDCKNVPFCFMGWLNQCSPIVKCMLQSQRVCNVYCMRYVDLVALSCAFLYKSVRRNCQRQNCRQFGKENFKGIFQFPLELCEAWWYLTSSFLTRIRLSC